MALRRKHAEHTQHTKRAQALIVFRIADSRHPIFDGTGAALIGGRWNSPGRAAIYAAGSDAGAMLERLMHAGTARVPKNQKLVLLRIPARVSVEAWTAGGLPRSWDADDNLASRAFGDEWLQRQRSAVLIVPSVVAKYENNVIINPVHADFRWIVASRPEKVIWDMRLFKHP
jgi:RES domain-containing protein